VTDQAAVSCDDALAAVFLGGPCDEAMRAHLATCPRCREQEPLVGAITQAFAASPTPEPPPGLTARVLRAAGPLLGRRAAWPALGRAVAAALAPLPLILWIDWLVVRTAERLLSTVLPGVLSTFVVVNYSILLALLLALTYGAVPILAERQARGRRKESHA
jgi:hypothetical protein